MATRKHFTKEFKLEAVRLLEHSGRSGTELARQIRVRRNQLYKWQSELRGKADPGDPPGKETTSQVTAHREPDHVWLTEWPTLSRCTFDRNSSRELKHRSAVCNGRSLLKVLGVIPVRRLNTLLM
jgi:transposase-like protein